MIHSRAEAKLWLWHYWYASYFMFSYLCCRCGQVQVPPCDAKTNIFSSEYSGSEFVAGIHHSCCWHTGHWSHTWGSGHSIVTFVTQDGGVSQWLVCPAPPQHSLQTPSWDPLHVTTLLRLWQSRVPEPGDQIEDYADISIILLSLSSCLNIVYR